MKSKITKLLFCSIFSGCMNAHYVANNPYVPFHSGKNELKINASYNSFQAGYSITDHVNIFYTTINSVPYSQTTFVFIGTNKINRTYSEYLENSEWNAGGGYFKKKEKHSWNITAGAGTGKVSFRTLIFYNSISPPEYYYFRFLGDKITYFIQPAFGIIENKNMEVGFFSKISLSQYYNLSDFHQKSDNLSVRDGDKYFLNKKTVDLFFAEPGLIARMGFKKFKLEIAISKIFNINYNNQITVHPVYVSLSLFMDFKLFKKKE